MTTFVYHSCLWSLLVVLLNVSLFVSHSLASFFVLPFFLPAIFWSDHSYGQVQQCGGCGSVSFWIMEGSTICLMEDSVCQPQKVLCFNLAKG